MGLDIGPTTIEIFTAALAAARTILWNGPMGVFEDPASAGAPKPSRGPSPRQPAVSVVGGGDSRRALWPRTGSSDEVSFVSTGGGASLELVELRRPAGPAGAARESRGTR